MADSTKIIGSLKLAANYSKLAFRKLGPKSYKKGQGALLKVLDKFGENGSLDKGNLEKVLDWRGKDLRKVAEKAQRNGYVEIADPEFKYQVTLTKKGKEVMEKRFAAEDKTADAILEALNAEERQQLLNITEKIAKTCEGLGVDIHEIDKKPHRQHRHHHDHCHHHHSHHGCEPSTRREAPKYVFVFEGGHHGEEECGCPDHAHSDHCSDGMRDGRGNGKNGHGKKHSRKAR